MGPYKSQDWPDPPACQPDMQHRLLDYVYLLHCGPSHLLPLWFCGCADCRTVCCGWF